MTFPLEFDLLMIRVCTFLQKKNKTKNKTKKNKKKDKKKIKKKAKKKKKVQNMFMSHILLHWVFVVGFIIGGLGEIFMRDELCESSLRSFVPWIMDDMYWIRESSNLLLGFSDHLSSLPFHH